MIKITKVLSAVCGVFFLPAWALAAPLEPTALGNGGEVYQVRAGTYGELLPDEDQVDAERSVMVLDVTLPGESTERIVVPPTVGAEVESSPRLVYSKQTGLLNVVWESRFAGEASLLLTRFDGSEWSSTVDEVYFDPDGVLPRMALTTDELHLDRQDGPPVDAERQILHLVWPQDADGQFLLGYAPVILMNGEYLGVPESLSLPHVNPTPDAPGNPVLPPTFRVTVDDEDFDRMILTFGSSSSRRITSYDILIPPMEVVYFSELIRDLVLDSEGFDPEDVAGFADTLGVHIFAGGLRSRALLKPSVVDYVATGTVRWLLDHGGEYEADRLDDLAADAGREALRLTTSLFSPPETGQPESSSAKSLAPHVGSDTLVIDVSDQVDGGTSLAPSHVLELHFAVEMPLPDSRGSELTLFTSDDGRRFVASWLDPEDEKVLWYTESGIGGNWQPHRKLHLGESLSLSEAHTLLRQRVR